MNAQTVKRILLGYIALTFALGIIAGFSAGMGYISAPMAMKGLLVFACASTVISLPLSWLWWSKVDEAAREAHKWAWFWGGSSGLLLILPLMAAFSLTDWAFYEQYLAFLHVRAGIGEFAAGMLTTLLCMSIGYLIAWVWWWWKRR
jgi:hypothetical protein